MTHAVDIQQRKADQQSFAITSGILVALLIVLLFIKLQHPVIQDAISGVMIDFGDNKEGLGNDNDREAGGQNSAPQKAVQQHEAVPVKSSPAPPVKASSPVKTPPNKTIVAEDPQAVAIAKMEKEKEAQRQKELLEQQKEQQRIAEAVKKAEAERVAKAAEEKRIKDQMAGVFSKGKTGAGNGTGNSSGNGTGNGQGNSKPGGNQGAQWGTPGGDPNGTGTGTNGNGPGSGDGFSLDLKGRKWRQRPFVFDNSQESGRVVVAIRVDKQGNIVFARYQQKGSTTTSSRLIQLAEQAALKAKINADPNADDEQVGTIAFNFTVQ